MPSLAPLHHILPVKAALVNLSSRSDWSDLSILLTSLSWLETVGQSVRFRKIVSPNGVIRQLNCVSWVGLVGQTGRVDRFLCNARFDPIGLVG